jgi:hypothetical protein
MARRFSDKPRETRNLLKGIVIAQTEGIATEDLVEVMSLLRV